jgi:holin-like protein
MTSRIDALTGLAWLLLFQSAGEVISRSASLSLPGPVIGMLLLLVGLRFERVSAPVSQAASMLLEHLSLLFVPVGVRMLVALVVSTWIGLAVTALVLRGMLKPTAVV